MASNLHGGYDYEFVDTPQDILICKICLLVSRDPHLSMCCGHVFCHSCLDHVKQSSVISNGCPVCRDPEFNTVVNKQTARLVQNLSVFCSNKARGCKWQGELSKVDTHLENNSGCEFENVECPIGCKKLLQRQHINNHTKECPCRLVRCKYCLLLVEHQFVNSKHKNECSRFPLPCPNKCKVNDIPREEMDMHRDVCDLQQVMCPNKCGIVIQRQYLADHIQSKCKHREIACQYCFKTDKCVVIEGQHKEKCHRYPLPCPNQCETQHIPREEVEEHRKMCPLEPVPCDYHSMGCQVSIIRKDHKKHIEEETEKHLHLVMSQLVITQKDLVHAQEEIANTKQSLAQTAKELTNSKQKLSDIETQLTGIPSKLHLFESVMIRLSKRPISDNSAWSTWWLPLKTNMVDTGYQTCPVVIKMPGFTKRKANKEIWHSDPFYTHDKGYKMCLCFNSCEYESVPFLLLHLCLMKGPHDSELEWPMHMFSFKLKLLNQNADKDHIECELLGFKNLSRGEDKFATYRLDHAALTSQDKFVKDDSVIFEVSKQLKTFVKVSKQLKTFVKVSKQSKTLTSGNCGDLVVIFTVLIAFIAVVAALRKYL